MLKNHLTNLLIILSSFVFGFDDDISQLKQEILNINQNELAKNTLSTYNSHITRSSNDTNVQSLANIKRLPKIVKLPHNGTILLDNALEKISRKHHDDHTGK